jgi:hypothetical protein
MEVSVKTKFYVNLFSLSINFPGVKRSCVYLHKIVFETIIRSTNGFQKNKVKQFCISVETILKAKRHQYYDKHI